ncbi:hypothetical protein PG993_006581 [Apiospora rasikravindrae]|uniref:Uncharacterized protein n=1 Tax=Apiospora rasikravindrae TaxID=990691 RepID=A0ABR1T640_9PEZI
MCYYKRATYSDCNHSQWSAQPMRECQVQRDFVAGRCREPCDTARGHPLATVKVEGQCAACRGQTDRLSDRLRRAKDIISVSKQTLIGADERCRAILEDVGIDTPFSDDETSPKSSPVSATSMQTIETTMTDTTASTVEDGSLAKEFLRKRKEQKDSKLYMT